MISSLSSLVFVFYPGFQEPHDAPWDKGLSYIISSLKFFDFGLSLKYQNQY